MLHSEETSAATAVRMINSDISRGVKRRRTPLLSLSAEEIQMAEMYHRLTLQNQWQLFQLLSTPMSNNNNNNNNNNNTEDSADRAQLSLGRWVNMMLDSHIRKQPQGNKEKQQKQLEGNDSYGDDLRDLFVRLQQYSHDGYNSAYGKRGRVVDVLQYHMPNIWSVLTLDE
ncbi:hypothetical protein LSM04_002071 [Trypanosoma melophagium]|uniref:uncharacterized protein n=1 Tax=Trypanosoma melophagium TaxID=715481 RepID=UPI00351A8BEF|nr:hypothetical protein LSM04_002071 [Trypanosoma melophagium]